MNRGRRGHSMIALLCVGLLVSGCYGPFNLVRRLHHWNGQVGGRWANEVVFLGLAYLLPVYSICGLGDVLIFNSIEFWTGDNPIDPPMTAGTKTIRQGNQTAVLERMDTAGGRQMHVKLFEGDRLLQEFSLEANLEGPTVLKDASGVVIGSAETLPDGTLVLYDAQGREQARHAPKDMDRVARKMAAASARQ